jgi:hypothetical protein
MKCTAGIHLHHLPDPHHGGQAGLLPDTNKTYVVAYGRESAAVGFIGRKEVVAPGARWPHWEWVATDANRRTLADGFLTRTAALEAASWMPRT